jgi:NTE family protein
VGRSARFAASLFETLQSTKVLDIIVAIHGRITNRAGLMRPMLNTVLGNVRIPRGRETSMTTAFVLSGGGIRGPLEVGALQSLLEHGIKPDFLVGTSAGAINSGFMAAKGPDLSAIPSLQAAWRKATKEIVYPSNVLTIAWRLLSGKDSAFPSDGMRKLIQDNLPPGVTTFGQLKCPCYLTAVDLRSSRLYLFGEDPSAPLVDAIMASSSIPVYQPPVSYQGLQLADGGVVACTPASVAMDKGATLIYAVNVGRGEEVETPVHGMLNILFRTLDTFIAQSLFDDLQRADADPGIELHHIHITAFNDLPFNDFSHTDEMFGVGKVTTDEYLAHPEPRTVALWREVSNARLHTVPGAREYILPRRR